MAKTKFEQSVFHPINRNKYRGTVPIICRSSWERHLAAYLDRNGSCLEWGSESCIVPYVSPLDGAVHRYFIDFNASFRTNEGVKKFLIEVKPKKELNAPKETPNKKKETFIREIETYKKNLAKWKAAKAFADKNGYKFIIVTEDQLFTGTGEKR